LGSRAGLGEREIPSTSLRAGSSLRLKNGCAQDDKVVERLNKAAAGIPISSVFESFGAALP